MRTGEVFTSRRRPFSPSPSTALAIHRPRQPALPRHTTTKAGAIGAGARAHHEPQSFHVALKDLAVAIDRFAADIAAELDKLRRADFILFNFPIYWFGMPAILKGWIDRVFVSGLCYGGRRIYDRGGLAGKRAMLAFSLGGREHMFGPGAIHGELETLLRPIGQGMLAYVGLTVLPHFAAFHVPYVGDEARGGVSGTVSGAFAWVGWAGAVGLPEHRVFRRGNAA